MPKTEMFSGGFSPVGPVHEVMEELAFHIRRAEKESWTKLEFEHDEDDCIAIWGKRPVSPEEAEAARLKRRKQYERLKKEFE